MNKIVLFSLGFLIVFSIMDSVWACTSFAVYSHQVVYGMMVVGNDQLRRIVTLDLDFKLESVTVDRGLVWVTDGSRLYQLDPNGNVSRRWYLPERVSGICFANSDLYATSEDGHTIYRMKID